MAGLFTHYTFSKDLGPRLGKNFIDNDSFTYGNQGPDPFYFSFLKYKETGVANFIHTRGFKDYLDRNKDSINKLEKDSKAYYYFTGSLCHFILDTTIHPRVNSFVCNNYTHHHIETELDRFFMEKQGLNPKKFKTYKLLEGKASAKDFYIFYKPYGANLEDMARAMENYRLFKKSTYYVNKSVLGPGLDLGFEIIGIDGLLTRTTHPFARFSNPPLFDLYKEALDLAPELIDNVLAYLADEKDLNPIFYQDYAGD